MHTEYQRVMRSEELTNNRKYPVPPALPWRFSPDRPNFDSACIKSTTHNCILGSRSAQVHYRGISIPYEYRQCWRLAIRPPKRTLPPAPSSHTDPMGPMTALSCPCPPLYLSATSESTPYRMHARRDTADRHTELLLPKPQYQSSRQLGAVGTGMLL